MHNKGNNNQTTKFINPYLVTNLKTKSDRKNKIMLFIR